MTAFMENINRGMDQVEFDISVEVDEELFMEIRFESTEHGDAIEIQTASVADMEEFFRQVDKAKEDFMRLKAQQNGG